MGLTPAREANAASERTRPGWEPRGDRDGRCEVRERSDRAGEIPDGADSAAACVDVTGPYAAEGFQAKETALR